MVKIGAFPFGVVSQYSPGVVEAYVSNASDRTISIIGYQETCQIYAVHDEGRNDSQLLRFFMG